MASFRELKVWQKAVDLVIEVYRLCKYLPREETYALSDQMRCAAVSIPSNIAEGQARNSNKDFIRFLYIAQGSRAELETQFEICKKLDFILNDELLIAENYSAEVGRMLRNLIKSKEQSLLQTANHQLPTTN
ncbi:MAG: four helix bundle protein [Anaerolineaceae bacterium]|nr:four helix bundle protein [Anaerolineaceae bacterium]